VIVLIPSYEPGVHLVPLVRRLREIDADLEIVVVDDGSGPAYVAVFAEVTRAGARVLRHAHNRGKGAALKTGFAFIADRSPGEDVVTADADGQHAPHDIVRMADGLREDAARGDSFLILGVRDFGGDVPWRSRFGNAVSRRLFRAAAGWRIADTQTGLRGIPAGMLAWAMAVPGDRFEYEFELLLRLRGADLAAREIPIDTVYLAGNSSSHFRPFVDSLRVTLPLVVFAGSSFLAFLADTLALLLFTALLPAGAFSLATAIVAARVVSASSNFAMNRRFVFRRRGRPHAVRHALRYTLLAALLLASNIVWMQALTGYGLPLLAAKIITEAVLFVLSYQAQRRFVFGVAAEAPTAYRPHAEHLAASTERHSDPIGASTRMDADEPHFERTP
jgi:glycosyltransferase involved in cell wall biosynthesis